MANLFPFDLQPLTFGLPQALRNRFTPAGSTGSLGFKALLNCLYLGGTVCNAVIHGYHPF